METKVASVAATPDIAKPQPQPAGKPAQAEATAPKGPEPDELRLVIEEDRTSGTYVYKTINRLTGEVVSQLPREDVLKLRDRLEYAAGQVVKTSA